MSSINRSGSVTNKRFTRISISLASPDSILSRSYGEILKPETINYRSFKPEKDGLFCEKIFGPTRDWECHCGKYKRIRYKGIICDRCGVEITLKNVRRERMGHITLATTVVHIWYFRSTPSKIGYLLGMGTKDLEKVIYYESYMVVNPGNTGLKVKELIPENEYVRIMGEFKDEYYDLDDTDPGKFVARIGGNAIKELLKRIDLQTLSKELRYQVKVDTSVQRKNEALKRLKVIEAFIPREGDVINRPEWMVLDVIPVIPPELRPLVPLEGGRFATSDLNDLYRRVIIRNNRLKKLIEIKAPEIILRNEKRMLQEAVDSLLDNGRRAMALRSDGNRPLKSLSDMLKGKQGRFRQNLLGKRVDYSGRSVIVVGPELKLHECGLPKTMAVELFKPFIIRKLVERGLAKTVKNAKKQVDRKGKEIWDILESIIEDHPVMLNRAPTLHRLGIQAFHPILVEGKAIRIHPLVCTAFNADFDGDQMAVHVPLSFESQIETKLLMMASRNILSPASGRPVITPSQDIVLGCYYMTKVRQGAKGEGKMFSSPEEVIIAFNNGQLEVHAKIKVRINKRIIETTPGRVLFNQEMPQELGYINELLTKKRLEEFVAQAYRKLGLHKTATMLDKLKDFGFRSCTQAGLSVGLGDVIIPPEKEALVASAFAQVDEIQKLYERGIITEGERYNKIIDIWTHTSNNVAERMIEGLSKSKQGFNPLFMMIDSGARGSKEQIRQLAGMRGLMNKPQKSMTGQIGEIIESPITANFLEGLSVLEYFISTHGARKGLADTALKTADAGYLTRRLVDVAQDVIITQDDCGTILGIETSALKEGEEVIESLHDRILGRVAVDDILDPVTEDILVEAGSMIDEAAADVIAETSIESIRIRSVLTCETRRGVCAKCYGRNLATGKMVNIGEATGVIAAQSIGEPGTQLTLRTFHLGGTASRIAAESEMSAKHSGRVQFENMKFLEREDGEIIILGRNGKIIILDKDERAIAQNKVPHGSHLLVKDGDQVKRGQILFKWDPYSSFILSDYTGKVKFVDVEKNVTYHEDIDDTTGKIHRLISETRNRNLNPVIQIMEENNLGEYILQSGAVLMVREGQEINKGDIAAKTLTQTISSESHGKVKFVDLRENANYHEEVDDITGKVYWIITESRYKNLNPCIHIVDSEGKKVGSYNLQVGMEVFVENEQEVKKGDVLAKVWNSTVSEYSGYVKFKDIEKNVNLRHDADEDSELKHWVITETKNKNLNPIIQIVEETSRGSYNLPIGAILMVEEGEKIQHGDVLVKLPREIGKTRDITGGLPRVAELFEARRPKDPAVISEIDGEVHFGTVKKGVRELIVSGKAGDKKTYLIPYGRHILVQDSDQVEAGERLTEGAVVPHDILRIKGANAVQEYLVNEIQEVYRMQGVRINDKHCEVIVRQMLQRVKVEDPGDTMYLESDQVDRLRFIEENERMANMVIILIPNDTRYKDGEIVIRYEIERINDRLVRQGKIPAETRPARPATFQPLLLGITQASLSTESFISAASFQETTKVLTDAAIEGKIDYLEGLKENVIMGHLIPAGTGLKKYLAIHVSADEEVTNEAEKSIAPEATKEVIEAK